MTVVEAIVTRLVVITDMRSFVLHVSYVIIIQKLIISNSTVAEVSARN